MDLRVHSISEAPDVNIVGRLDGQTLVWNATTRKHDYVAMGANTIYNADGSLSGDRIVNLATFDISFISGNVGVGTTTFGTNGDAVLGVGTGVAPTTSPVDMFQMYSADIVAGNAAPHFRTELGDIVKLFTGASIADPSGGLTVDSAARTAIIAILNRMRVTGGNGTIAD